MPSQVFLVSLVVLQQPVTGEQECVEPHLVGMHVPLAH